MSRGATRARRGDVMQCIFFSRFFHLELHYLPVIGVGVPYIWLHLVMNVFTQYPFQ